MKIISPKRKSVVLHGMNLQNTIMIDNTENNEYRISANTARFSI